MEQDTQLVLIVSTPNTLHPIWAYTHLHQLKVNAYVRGKQYYVQVEEIIDVLEAQCKLKALQWWRTQQNGAEQKYIVLPDYCCRHVL